jgi:hypothetical protein
MRIYLDRSLFEERDAPERLVQLLEAGHELVLVGPAANGDEGPLWVREGPLASVARAPAVPTDPPLGSWFVTGNPAACGDHRADLRTLLVGPRLDDRRPTRCDATARDLREAVLDILAAEAMH